MKKEYKYYTVYQITNKINSKIYIGVHRTNNLKDTYFGSGTIITLAVKKYGRKIFKKEILFIFDNEEEMLAKELEIVNEKFIERNDTYNLVLGGETCPDTTGLTTVKDKDGNISQVSIDDPRYLNGELVGVTKGFFKVKDYDGNIFNVEKDDPRYLNGELVGVTKGFVPVKDKNGKTFQVSINDKRLKVGELTGISKGQLAVKDKNGNILFVYKTDDRYLNGELKFHWTGKIHKEETKKKIGEKNSFHQKGEKNSQYGSCWIYNEKLKENKKIKKESLVCWLNKGWEKGRKLKFK